MKFNFQVTTWGRSGTGRTQLVTFLFYGKDYRKEITTGHDPGESGKDYKSMSKEETLQALRSSREVSTMEDTPNWRKAFELYNVAHGTKLKAQDRCQKCFQKVLDFIQK